MRVAFLGLGKMGTGMAGRLIAAGHSLTVYNRNPERSAPFGRLGARVAGSARSAAERADIIIGMTADDESSRAVWLGDFGALAADNLQKMGYKNVLSMDGGYRGWNEAGYPTTS